MNVIVFDTETTNSIDDPIIYDIGWAVIDLDSREILKTESYAVADVILDKELMNSAYYAEKLPSYWDEIKNGDRKLARLRTINNSLKADCRAYDVKEMYAHNARFDYRSCTLSQRYLTSSKYRFFLPYNVKICDTLKMARKAFNKDSDYCEFCDKNGYKTKRNQNRLTAEILYRYLTGNNEFEEEHKGLADVLIEKEILFACRDKGIVEGALWE